MKVKLLTPIPGYEDVAEFRDTHAGDEYLTACRQVKKADNFHGAYIVLTPKPLPIIIAPQWLGVVQQKSGRYGFVTHVDDSGVVLIAQGGGACMWIPAEQLTLIRTANIETSPELESLFKDA